MKTTLLILVSTGLALAQPAPDRLMTALQDKALVTKASRLDTDRRITFYQDLVKSKPADAHYQILLAGAYIQKMRETTDFGYIDRAARILDQVVAADPANYEALRLQTEIGLERHNFTKAAEFSKRLTQLAPQDPFNWGALGDAYIELGDYDRAADAYQTMINLRPDLSSYNRAAHYRFLNDDLQGAIRIMKLAIEAGSASPENVAWCQVELGNYYFKSGKPDEAALTYRAAIRTFPNYHPGYAALGKVQAEQGQVSAAVESYLRAQSITPMPDYAAALHDLYLQSGNVVEAGKQMALVDAIDRLSKANHEKANRNLALIYADHDRRLERALELARAELEFRQDVYTYDALAWALYKNGRFAEASAAMEKAMKLNTPEPAFKMHAARIKKEVASR